MIVALVCATAACGPDGSSRVAARVEASRRTPGTGIAGLPSPGIIAATPLGAAISNEGGSLKGTVLGPAAAIISNNGAGLIGNNGAGLIGNNGAGFRIRSASDRLAPVAGAHVELVDAHGRAVAEAPATTDAEGGFAFPRLNPSGPVLFINVRYRLAGRDVTMAGVATAPGPSEGVAAPVTPASTMIAAKVSLALAAGHLKEGEVAPQALARAAGEVAAAMSDRAIAEAVLLPAREVVVAFERLLGERPETARAVEAIAGPILVREAVADGATPSPGPSAAPSPSPGATPSSAAAPTIAPTATAPPWPESAYLVRRAAGSAQGGMSSGASRLSDTFMRLTGLVLTPANAFIVADGGANQIRRLPASGPGTLIAGLADGSAGFDPSTIATESRLDQPHGLAYDSVAGNVFFCDTGNNRVRKLAGGILTTLAGGGADTGDSVAVATDALLDSPIGLARDDDGTLFFTERTSGRVGRVAADGSLTTLARGIGTGPIALDEANDVLWVAKDGVVTAIIDVHGGTPTVVASSTFVVPAGAASPQVTGLAYDDAGALYVAQASFPLAGPPVDVRYFRVPVDASGRGTGTPVVIAGTGAQAGEPSAYSAPSVDTNGLTLVLANANWCALTFGPDGKLYAGNSYPGQWGQVLRLSDGP